MPAYYPLMVNLAGRPCVVVGGGEVAERKVETLLEFGAIVTVVSSTLTPALTAALHQGRIAHIARPYRPGDLTGAFLAIAATDEPRTNRAVHREGKERAVWVNVVDDPEECDFIAPSLVTRGDLVIAISTWGSSPALAKKIRESLEEMFGEEYAELLALLNALRERVRREIPDPEGRKAFFEEILRSDILTLLKGGNREEVTHRVEELLSQAALPR